MSLENQELGKFEVSVMSATMPLVLGLPNPFVSSLVLQTTGEILLVAIDRNVIQVGLRKNEFIGL